MGRPRRRLLRAPERDTELLPDPDPGCERGRPIVHDPESVGFGHRRAPLPTSLGAAKPVGRAQRATIRDPGTDGPADTRSDGTTHSCTNGAADACPDRASVSGRSSERRALIRGTSRP